MREQSVSRPRYKAEKLTTWIDCGLLDCWNCPKQNKMRWHTNMMIWKGQRKWKCPI